MDARITIPVESKPDAAKPADATVEVTPKEHGRSQVRVNVTPPEKADPAVPKPDEKKPAADSNRPAWLPENFKTPEDLVASYKELQKKNTPEAGKPVVEVPKPEPKVEPKQKVDAEGKPVVDAEGKPVMEEAPKPAPVVKTAEENKWEIDTYGPMVKAVLDKAGVKAKKMADEYTKTGKVSDETYAKFAEAGINKNTLDQYLAGGTGNAQALADQHITEIKAEVGGPDAFDLIVGWAKANMKSEDIDAYNSMVSTGNLGAAKRGVAWLASEYEKANGKPPKLVNAPRVPGGDVAHGERFNSTHEIVEAMKDPRYKAGDKAYHAIVDAKLKNSKII